MDLIKRLLNSPYWLWALLAVPSLPILADFWERQRYYPEMMHITAIWATGLLVVTMAITPSLLILKRIPSVKPIGRWLAIRRRHLGVASFLYAALHTLLYIRQMEWDIVILFLELEEREIITGWIALLIMAVLAAVSNRWGVQKLGIYWKPVQRLVYFSAVLIFLHWFWFNIFIELMWQWLIALLIIKAVHIALRNARKLPRLSLQSR